LLLLVAVVAQLEVEVEVAEQGVYLLLLGTLLPLDQVLL